MLEVGSESWVRAFATAVEGVAVEATARVVVQHELSDTGDAWHVVVDGGRVAVSPGHHPDPDVTFRQDRATAAAVAAGELSAEQAFIDGRLEVRGAVGALVGATAAALASLPGVAA